MRTSVRGHRMQHTASEHLEAWGPTRAACLEEAAMALAEQVAVPHPDAPRRRHELHLDEDGDGQLLLEVLSEVIFLADAEAAVPAAVEVRDDHSPVLVLFDLVDLGETVPRGPAPRGVPLSGLALHDDGARWVASALLDV